MAALGLQVATNSRAALSSAEEEQAGPVHGSIGQDLSILLQTDRPTDSWTNKAPTCRPAFVKADPGLSPKERQSQ